SGDGSITVQKRTEHEFNDFDRRKGTDRYNRDGGGYDSNLMHRSESLSMSRRSPTEFPKGSRSKDSGSGVLSWQRFRKEFKERIGGKGLKDVRSSTWLNSRDSRSEQSRVRSLGKWGWGGVGFWIGGEVKRLEEREVGQGRGEWVSRRLQNLTPFKPTTILQPRRTFCAKSPANANNGNFPETSVSSYHEQYKQLEKLDFMTATKCSSLLSLRKLNLGIARFPFGTTVLLLPAFPGYVSSFIFGFSCGCTSLSENLFHVTAVCLGAQYARYEITRMVAVKVRLDKLDEALKEIVVESKTQTTSRLTRDHKGSSGKKNVVTWATNTSSSDSSKPSEKDHFGKQGSGNQDRLGKERVNGWHPVPYTSLKDKQGKIER
ncbi:hypothetical protein DVH24_039189, partial [Malus domestica]